ncbi:MAG: ZIP family metal transporter [Pseudomonadales bacterium]|nr:ZIP family metal transporter [Pseudomonadales bacterium]
MSAVTSAFWAALGTSLAGAAVTTAGIVTIRRHAAWGERNSPYFMCFAAGVLVSASFLHMIPRAIAMTTLAPTFLLAGFLGLFLSNRFLTAYVCQREPGGMDPTLGLVPLLGIGLHSLLDGVVYTVTFQVSVLTGVLATIGMVLHEFPEGIVIYLLLLRGGTPEGRAARWAFFAAALSTPAGMLLSWPFVRSIDAELLGALLAVCAGALVYVGATHLLPRAEQAGRRFGFVALLGGVLVGVIIVWTKG